MSLVTQTGFGPVTHNIAFNSSAMPKEKLWLFRMYVVRVEELRCNNISELIRCSAIRQASISTGPYKVQVELNFIKFNFSCCIEMSILTRFNTEM